VAAAYVTVLLDRYDGAGNPLVRGRALWAPSLDFPSPELQQLIGRAPVSGAFRAGSLPVVSLLACDTAGPQKPDGTPGWTWNVWYEGVPGHPQPASYYIVTASGLTQRLSDLAQVPVAQPGQQYLPVPQGTPAAGQVPVVALSGDGSGWYLDWEPNGTGGDKTYTQAFSVARTVSVTHDLGKYPAVTVIDSAGDEVEGDVAYAGVNSLTVRFSAPFSGTVTCN
jgi:hypothetical protein